jgi:hypothetical protein
VRILHPKLIKERALSNSKRLTVRQSVMFASVFAIVGAFILISTHAAGPTTSLEAESSTLAGCATSTSDSNASGGGALKFTNCNGQVTSATSVTQYGVTWDFSAARPVGQFANGDWWVQGPVTITSITPNASGGTNGWQVNPSLIENRLLSDDRGSCIAPGCGSQSIDSLADDYNAGGMPALPYTANGGQSIFKGISNVGAPQRANCPFKACIKEGEILTVLSSVPPNNGATVFRPPYMGTSKPLYSTNTFDTQMASLPSYASTSAIDAVLPTMTSALNIIKRPDVSTHVEELSMFRATVNLSDSTDPDPYSPVVNSYYVTSEIRALIHKTGDDEVMRRQIMIDAVQRGIDVSGALNMGMNYYSAGGVNFGRMLPIVLAAYMLDNTNMKSQITSQPHNGFQETGDVWPAQHAGTPLWGQDRATTETEYWQQLHGNMTENDPYGYIDGGNDPPQSYQQCCSAQSIKASATVVHLLHIESIWDDPDSLAFAARWTSSGAHTQPDPCAPDTQSGGPDPAHSGQCILDPDLNPGSTFTSFSCQAGKKCGRFPDNNGTFVNGGLDGSDLADAMWTKYSSTW